VRAHYELCFAGTNALEGSGFLPGISDADEELDTVATTFKNAARGKKVLDGEDFRGRHQSSLATVLDGDHRGLQRDDSFTAADVALQKAIMGAGFSRSEAISARTRFVRRWA